MAKKDLTQFQQTDSHVRGLADQVKNQAPLVKLTMDQFAIDMKAYTNTSLISELADATGSTTIGHSSASITADNAGDALEENRVLIDLKATDARVDEIEGDLAGAGRTTETIKTNSDDIGGLEDTKADKATTYTKTEVDSLDNNLQGQIDTNDDDVISLQGQINANDNEIADNDIDILALQNNKADKATTYTKTEVDSLDNNLQGQIDTNDTDIIGLQGQIDDNDIDIITKADKANVLELDNTLAFIPDTDYEPSTKRYVDTTVNDATMAVLPEGSITDNYLSDAVGQIKNRVETGIIDEDNTKNYATQLKVVSGKPVLEYEEVL